MKLNSVYRTNKVEKIFYLFTFVFEFNDNVVYFQAIHSWCSSENHVNVDSLKPKTLMYLYAIKRLRNSKDVFDF